MNIMNCLGSATVPKSLALQSQGWSFAATLRAGETEQQGWKIESYAATWVIEASASTCGPYWMLLYWMQPQNLRFLICVLRGSMGIWCEWWNPVFLYLGPRTCFFWRPLLIILFCPWHKNRPWKHTPCKIQEDFWVLCSTNLVQTYVCKLNIKLDIYLRTYIYIYICTSTLPRGGVWTLRGCLMPPFTIQSITSGWPKIRRMPGVLRAWVLSGRHLGEVKRLVTGRQWRHKVIILIILNTGIEKSIHQIKMIKDFQSKVMKIMSNEWFNHVLIINKSHVFCLIIMFLGLVLSDVL